MDANSYMRARSYFGEVTYAAFWEIVVDYFTEKLWIQNRFKTLG